MTTRLCFLQRVPGKRNGRKMSAPVIVCRIEKSQEAFTGLRAFDLFHVSRQILSNLLRNLPGRPSQRVVGNERFHRVVSVELTVRSIQP